MKGLFYKDMICSRIPQLLLGIAAGICVPVILILIAFEAQEDRELLLFLLFCMETLTIYLLILGIVVTAVAGTDFSPRIEAYMRGLPVSRGRYIATKYLLIFSIFFTLLVLSSFLFFMGNHFIWKEILEDPATQIISWLPAVTSLFLIIAAIELPFYFYFGIQTGSSIRIILLMIAVFAILIFILFGNVNGLMNKFNNPDAILKLLAKDSALSRQIKWGAGIAMIIIYVLSGLLSYRLYSRKQIGE